MFVTADQLLAHCIGDYLLQSYWMATQKTRQSVAALAHVLTYALPFLFLRPSLPALAVIVTTHFIIDRFRLARYLCWAKNWLGPFRKQERCRHLMAQVANCGGYDVHECGARTTNRDSAYCSSHTHAHFDYLREPHAIVNLPFVECAQTGFAPDVPAWLATWLMIIVDNLCHILINAVALQYL